MGYLRLQLSMGLLRSGLDNQCCLLFWKVLTWGVWHRLEYCPLLLLYRCKVTAGFFPLQVYTGGNVMEVLEAVDDYLPEGGGRKAVM